MNKSKVKQIYLLLVAIFGIVAISVYSTYAIFTLESASDDIVSIRTPSNLHIVSNTYEYKQVTVAKNSYIDADIDIYNNLDYELCYSVWYKPLSNQNKISVYEKNADSLTSSSTLTPVTGRRISLLLINDSDTDVKVNIGVVYEKNEGTCKLNIANDKLLVNTNLDAKELSQTLIDETKPENIETGYLTYKELTDTLTLDKDSTYYVANEFSYKDELFTLKESKTIDFEKISDYDNYYLCLSNDSCEVLYHIIDINNENRITKYDMLIGYLAGENGLRKVSDNYYYYGDNPHNFIYYNCTNEQDTKTCELWRIMGFYHDKENDKYLPKIIRNDYLETHIFDENNNTWDESNVAKYFDKEYKLTNDNLVTEFKFKMQNVISLDTNLNQINTLEKENKAKITLMELTDYLYASSCQKDKINEYDASCLKNNWLNKNQSELTMTAKYELPYLNEETNEMVTPLNNKIYMVGNEITEANIDDKNNLRPVIYLKSRTILTDGNGTIDNPYIIR